MQTIRRLVGVKPVAFALCLLMLLPTILIAGCGSVGGGSPRMSESDTCPTCSQPGTGGTVTAEPLPATVKRVATFRAYKPDEATPTQYYTEDGTPITQAELSAAFLALPKDENKSIGIEILNQKPAAPGSLTPKSPVFVGCLMMDVRWENGPVSKCFKLAGTQWHLNFHFRNWCTNRDYFNLHAKAWWDNGPQFGLYESERDWCFRSVGKWTAIRDKFMASLALVGVTGMVAYVISDISAGITVAAFAL